MRFVWEVFAFASSAPQHLLEEDSGLHRSQENDAFQVWNVHTGREKVNSDDDAGRWAITKLTDVLEWAIHSARNLLNKRVPPAKDIPSNVHQLVGVGSVRQVIHCKDQGLREPAVVLLVLQCPCLQFFQNLSVRIRDLLLDLRAIELALVFQQVKLFGSRDRVDNLDVLSFIQKNSVQADVGLDRHNVVINQKALTHRPLVLVAINDVLEVGHRVGSRCRGQANLDAVEVIERFPPDRAFLSRVASVTFIGNNQVKSVDRDVFFRCVYVNLFVSQFPKSIKPKQIDRHPLDGADVDEGVSRFGIFEVMRLERLRIKLLILVKVPTLESLTVNLVNLVKLQPQFRLERSKR